MSKSITLADIRAAAEKKFASTDITLEDGTVVVLRNALKLSKEERKAVSGVGDAMREEDADMAEVLENALVVAAKDAGSARRLIEEIGGDVTVLLGIFEAYTKETELGEASDSES